MKMENIRNILKFMTDTAEKSYRNLIEKETRRIISSYQKQGVK